MMTLLFLISFAEANVPRGMSRDVENVCACVCVWSLASTAHHCGGCVCLCSMCASLMYLLATIASSLFTAAALR